MTSTFSVVDASSAIRGLRRFAGRDADFAVALTLTRVAKGAAEHIRHQMPKRFDRSTPFTRRAPMFKPATKMRQVATIGIRPLTGRRHYLAVQETGGVRTPQNQALLVPVNVRLNQFGNMPKGLIKRLKSKGYRPSNRDGKTYGGGVFAGTPKGMSKARAGIWERPRRTSARSTGRKTRRGKDQLKLLVAFEDTARYERRFRFRTSAEGYVKGVIARELERALRDVAKGRR